MDASFNGSVKKPRQINLGGKTAAFSTHDVLRKAQADRELREITRRKTKAALVLQRFFIGRLSATRTKQSFRNEWDETFNSDASLRLLRMFSFFFDPAKDVERGLRMLARVVGIISSAECSFLLITFGKQVVVMLAYCNEAQVIEFLHFLSGIDYLLASIADKNYYMCLSALAISPVGWKAEVAPLVVEASIQPLKVSLVTYEAFSTYFLSTASYFNNLKPHLLERILKGVSWRVVVERITMDSLDSIEPQRRLWLLANFHYLTRASANPLSMSSPLLMKAASTLFNSTMAVQPLMATSSEVLQLMDPFVKMQLNTFTDNSYVLSVISHASIDNISPLADFFISLMRFWPSKRASILLCLGAAATATLSKQKDNIIGLLWSFVKSTQLHRHACESRISLKQLQRLIPVVTWSPIVLLLDLYSYTLMVLDDAEFFDDGRNPVSLREVEQLAAFLKNLGFCLVWNHADMNDDDKLPGAGMPVDILRATTIRLLRQIYQRENFLPPDFWLMTSRFEMESFITTVVEEEQKRHEALEEDESEAKDAITSTHQRHRFLSTIAPRLELLQNLPFFIPFDTRVQIFRAFVQLDKSRQQIGEDFFGFDYSKLHANIRRETVFEDAFEAFHTLGRRFKRPLSITFYNENGQEAGIDGGGLTKELITSLCRQAFDANYALFKETSNNLVYPNPDNYAKQQAQLQAFEFLGLVIGKCFYEGILIDIAFAPFFLLNWVGGYRTSINDLRDLDEELYQGLNNLKDYKGDVESDLSLNFTISDEDYGAVKSVELRIDGSNTPVTNLNRLEYIHEVARYRLETKIAPQVAAFLRGLSQMIESHWFSMFNQSELQTVIGGAPIPIDVVDLKRNTSLAGYQENDPIISNFWQVLNDYSDDNRRKLIKFVTSVSRPPLLGFRELKPSFALQRAGEDETRLPTASTCVNLLKLPPYSTKEILWQKLTYAINSEAGFDLS